MAESTGSMTPLKKHDTTKWNIKDRIKDRYEVFDIKFGGMGIVYLCFDHVFKKPVVLKTLQDRFLNDKSLLERFMWEAEIWVRLEKHQNIVRAEYINKIDDLPYIFMEYIVGDEQYGSDLKGWIVNGGLDLTRSINFGLQFCSGMIYAATRFKEMGRPFIYRDIKPSNLMVTRERILKITDFGLVKLSRTIEKGKMQEQVSSLNPHNTDVSDFEKTRAGSIMGTPPYMAPEAWAGVDVDHRADIYSFGCVLYEMINGRPPFLCQTLSDYKFHHQEAVPNPINSAGKELNILLKRCMSKKKQDRYQTFNELKKDLLGIYQGLTHNKYVENESNQDLEIWELENKGISLFNLGYKTEAINCYNEVIKAKPDYAQVYHDRGIAFKSMGKINEAIDDYNKAIQLKPDFENAYYNRGIALHSAGRIKDAIKDFDASLKYKPDNVKALYNRAISCRADGLYEKALNDFTTLININNKNPRAFYNRGICLFALRKFDLAIKDYQTALEISPLYCEAQYNLSLTYKEMNKNSLALDGFQKYIDMAQNIPSQKQWISKAKEQIQILNM